MKDIVIIDLDGTLCNTSHRDHLIGKSNSWDEFHAELHNDTPYEETVAFIDAMNNLGKTVIALTGRMEKFRQATTNWLVKHNIMIDELWMRGDSDYRRAFEIKRERLASIKDRVLVVLDDNDKVVEALRNEGFRVWQVQNGGY